MGQTEITNYEREIQKRQNLLRQFFNSKYHRLRVILFYLKRFTYLTLFADYKGKFKDKVKIKKVVKQKSKDKKSIRVLYDFQTFSAQKCGGISRLFYELINNFVKNNDVSPELAIRYSENYYLSDASFLKSKAVINSPPPVRHFSELLPTAPFLENRLTINLLRKIFLKILSITYFRQPGVSLRSLNPNDYYSYYIHNVETAINVFKKGDFDIFHPTYYDTYFLKYLNGKPFVLTIFDMMHEKFSQYHHSNDIISKQKKILAQKASKIIAISEQTKKDVINILKIPDEKIVVIPLASSFHGKPKKMRIPGLPKKYILFVGTRTGYKNFNFFVKSISSLLRNDKSLFLVCVGDKPASGCFNEEEHRMFKSLKISNKLIYYRADDNTLQNLYSKATLFAFPTLSEGFGIPVLEAFSCKCPVVCSNISVLKETVKDGAVYFEPRNKDSILNAVRSILTDNKFRLELIAKATKINNKYSWKKVSEETQKVYKEVLNTH